MITSTSITSLLTLIVRWAVMQDQPLAAALLDSYARGEARPESDVDLLITASDPGAFGARHRGYPISHGSSSVCRSHRLMLGIGLEVEVGFAASSWAAINPWMREPETWFTGGV
jgi:Nucleotidyltransferase domain